MIIYENKEMIKLIDRFWHSPVIDKQTRNLRLLNANERVTVLEYEDDDTIIEVVFTAMQDNRLDYKTTKGKKMVVHVICGFDAIRYTRTKTGGFERKLYSDNIVGIEFVGEYAMLKMAEEDDVYIRNKRTAKKARMAAKTNQQGAKC